MKFIANYQRICKMFFVLLVPGDSPYYVFTSSTLDTFGIFSLQRYKTWVIRQLVQVTTQQLNYAVSALDDAEKNHKSKTYSTHLVVRSKRSDSKVSIYLVVQVIIVQVTEIQFIEVTKAFGHLADRK